MIAYGKTARCALAAASYLARLSGKDQRAGSKQIAEAINLPQPLVAKVLTTVSQAGIVHGTRGPNGGYTLAKKPNEITINDIVNLFGLTKGNDDYCPMGPGHCGVKNPCPLHHTINKLRENASSTFGQTTLDVFSCEHLIDDLSI